MSTVVSRVKALLPEIARRSVEIERERHIPEKLVTELLPTGCFRMLAPACHGGGETTLPEALRVIELIASADGATGWIVGQIASAQLIFSCFPIRTISTIYKDGPDVFGAGAVAPKGHASRIPGGWRISGQWPFASGCERASWIYAHCLVLEDHRVQMLPNGMPETRMALFPASEVQILDTWHVSGLQGTASHDIRLTGASCPEERTAVMVNAQPALNDPIFSIPFLDQGGLFIAAVAAGIAGGAIDDISKLAAGGKRPAFERLKLSESPLFQDSLGAAYLNLRAAQALLYNEAEKAWSTVIERRNQPLLERAVLRAVAARVTSSAAQVVDAVYTLGGGSSLYMTSPLQRRLRDIHAVTQHTYAGRYNFGVVGGLLAGEKFDQTLF